MEELDLENSVVNENIDKINDSEEANDSVSINVITDVDENNDPILLEDKPDKLTRLPIARVKTIMKFDEQVYAASQEATFLVTKATELFLQEFMKEVHQCTLASKKKTVSLKDVETAVFVQNCFLFLDGVLN